MKIIEIVKQINVTPILGLIYNPENKICNMFFVGYESNSILAGKQLFDLDNGRFLILHNPSGPALYTDYNDKSQYYILGSEVSKEQFYTPGFIDSFILENS
jgi:hypothetical protein